MMILWQPAVEVICHEGAKKYQHALVY